MATKAKVEIVGALGYRTIYTLNDLVTNKETGKKELRIRYYFFCVVHGRNPVWTVYDASGNIARHASSKDMVQQFYPKLAMRSVMARWSLADATNHSIEKRVQEVAEATGKRIPKEMLDALFPQEGVTSMAIGKWRARQTIKWLRDKASKSPRGAAAIFLEEGMTEEDLEALKTKASELLAFVAKGTDGDVTILVLGLNLQAGFSAMCMALRELCDDDAEQPIIRDQLIEMRAEILATHGVAVTSDLFDGLGEDP